MHTSIRVSLIATLLLVLVACGRPDAPSGANPTTAPAPTMLPTAAAEPTAYPAPTIPPDASLVYPAPTIDPNAGAYPVPSGTLAGAWSLLTYGQGGTEEAVIDGSTIALTINADGTLGGSSGCNTYSGSYTVNNDALSVSGLASTKMACAEAALMDQEQAYLTALEGAERFVFEGDRLIIQYNGLQSSLIFVPQR